MAIKKRPVEQFEAPKANESVEATVPKPKKEKKPMTEKQKANVQRLIEANKKRAEERRKAKESKEKQEVSKPTPAPVKKESTPVVNNVKSESTHQYKINGDEILKKVGDDFERLLSSKFNTLKQELEAERERNKKLYEQLNGRFDNHFKPKPVEKEKESVETTPKSKDDPKPDIPVSIEIKKKEPEKTDEEKRRDMIRELFNGRF